MTLDPETVAQMRYNATQRLGRPTMPEPREASRTIRLCDAIADAWDEAAEYGWRQSGEGFNGEYANGTTHDGAIPLTEAMGDDYTNPYREEIEE